MNVRKTVFKLALMCKSTKCMYCTLSVDGRKCALRSMTLMELAQAYFDVPLENEGCLWIKFANRQDYLENEDSIMNELYMPEIGKYQVKAYVEETKEITILRKYADDGSIEVFKERYGEDNIELMLPTPKGV